jgi:acid phosphatase (class A)
MRRGFAWAALAVIVAASAPAAHAQPVPAAKALAVSKFLAPGDLNPALVLPPPPADGSALAAAEIAELHALAAARTPERLAQAKHDAEVEDVTAIAEVLGPAFDLARFPATAQLFKDLRNEDSVAAKAAKKLFNRTRPWAADAQLGADPNLEACDKGEPKSSYPSGHTTMGYAAGAVLAQLMPGNAQVILARASDYAESRLVCGVHYRRDTEAGHVLATALVDRLMTKPAFQQELEAARTELTAAHIAP